MSTAQIIFFIISMLILAAVFVFKTKKHANDNRIRRPGSRRPRQ